MMKISQVAKLSGVTVRTLRYYDEIGLLKPNSIGNSGYRLYDDANLETLQQILFFRELDFPLNEIKKIMLNPGYDRAEALKQHRELLLKKQERLNRLIALVNTTLKGENTMNFKEFDMTEIEEMKEKYAAEVEERWGNTDAYAESVKKTKGYDAEKWQALNQKSTEIFDAFSAIKDGEPDGEAAQTLVKKWQAFITDNYYHCTTEILSGLGQMYSADERFRESIDQSGEGTAAFMSAAIAVYCQ